MWRYLRDSKYDIIIITSTLLLLIIGELFIFSTALSADGSIENYQYLKQGIWIILGIILLLVFLRMNLDILLSYTNWAYFLILFILLLTGILSQDRNGARAWLGILGLGIQPSEFAKLCFILFLSKYIGSRNQEELASLPPFWLSLGITLVPMALIVMQGDLGTAIVFAPIWFITLYIMGGSTQLLNHLFSFSLLSALLLFVQIWEPYSQVGGLLWSIARIFSTPEIFNIFVISLAALLLVAFVVYFFYKVKAYKYTAVVLAHLLFSALGTWLVYGMMKDYMRNRIISFLNPEINKLSSSWNLIQSIRAIGSGGLQGKGYLRGFLAHYGYLPEQSQSTDFLFAVIGEEGGFILCSILFLAYFLLIVRMVFISRSCENAVHSAIAIAISSMFFFHFMQNVGMTIHLMPITGIPLLLVSYGGSSLMTSMALIGIVLNIHSQRKR